jgi:hypothetical protein
MPRIEAPPVEVGQVWACLSIREQGRSVEVIAIRGEHAVVKVLTDSDHVRRELESNEKIRQEGSECVLYGNARSRVGEMRRIRLDRMRPTMNGYELIASAAVATDDAIADLIAGYRSEED